MWLLKREDQKRAGTLRRGGPPVPRVATNAEVQDALVKALRRYGDRLRAQKSGGGEAEAAPGAPARP